MGNSLGILTTKSLFIFQKMPYSKQGQKMTFLSSMRRTDNGVNQPRLNKQTYSNGYEPIRTLPIKKRASLLESVEPDRSVHSLVASFSNVFDKGASLLQRRNQDLRQTQMKQIASAPAHKTTTRADKLANRRLTLACAALGLTVLGQVLLLPPITYAGTVVILTLWRRLLQKAYKALIVEHRLSVEVANSLFSPIALLLGYQFAVSLGYITFFLSEKIILMTEDQSMNSLINIFGQQPRHVWVLQNGVESQIPFEALQAEDLVIVTAGEMIPIDGIIQSGIATVDQRVLTGESQPVDKEEGDSVFAATVVLSGKIHIIAEKTGEETAAAQISQILSQTKDFKSYIRNQGVELADRAVPLRLALGLIAWPLIGGVGALVVLNARFCAQMRTTCPLAMLNFLQITSRNGILVKDGRSLEMLGKVDTVVFDKTGTLTQEQPYVGTIYTCNDYQQESILFFAATAEHKQTHPIALAILDEAQKRQLTLPKTSSTQYEVGYGLKVSLGEQMIRVGSGRFMHMEGIEIPVDLINSEAEAHELGYSLVYVAIDDEIGGAIELRPTVRPEAKRVIEYLHERQIETYIISGDHEKPTQKLAEELGIENYFAETLPENKAALVERLQNEGRFVCFVGDGINDSIALKKANVSVSLSGASSVATDTAEMILMDKTLNQLTQAFDIADAWIANFRRAFLASTIPQAAIVAGAFFFGFEILSAIAVHWLGLYFGVANAMWPLYQYQLQEAEAGALPTPFTSEQIPAASQANEVSIVAAGNGRLPVPNQQRKLLAATSG